LLARANCYLKRFERGKEVASAEAAIRDATRARELAPSAREKADAYYRLALLHSQLFQQGGTAAKDHRNKSIENVSEAVELTPGGANGVTYRTRGATFITNAIADWASEIDRTSPQAVAEFAKQAIERLAGAEKWLKDAISLEQDAERQKRIEVQLKVVQKNIEDLRAKLPPAPAPPANE
jgi:tetratricopeptide (TPR) repeat protein